MVKLYTNINLVFLMRVHVDSDIVSCMVLPNVLLLTLVLEWST